MKFTGLNYDFRDFKMQKRKLFKLNVNPEFYYGRNN